LRSVAAGVRLDCYARGPVPASPPPPTSSRAPRAWRGLAALVAGVAIAVALCQRLLLTVCLVSGASMLPSLPPGSRVGVLRVGADLARGDLVVLSHPDAPEELLVKRVVGLAGERVRMARGRVWIDGRELDEPWLAAGTVSEGLPETLVPAGHLLVLGDNRGDSVDSRRFGPVDLRHLHGKVIFVWR
jgi:signal peptidase I